MSYSFFVVIKRLIPADGKGEGFGNPISIQTVAIVKAARALKRVYKVNEGRPVCTRVVCWEIFG